jgi:YVTN family beta-propeller protein
MVNFNGASFSCLNDKTQSLVIYSTLDSSWNPLTFTIVNNTGIDLSLTGGTPVNSIGVGLASSFSFSFRTILTEAQAKAMTVKDSLDQWGSLYFPPDAHTNPTWAVAPLKDMIFKNGDKIEFSLGNITCTTQTPSYLDVLYFNVPGVNARTFPFSYLVSVLNPPTGKDLTSVVDCGILNGSVHHLIQPAPYPPPGGNGPPPIEVDITYDNNFPILNGFTVYLKNNSGSPLVPPGTPLGGAVFTFTFLFGTDDDDAITTQALGDSIAIDVNPNPPSQWSSTAHQQGTGNWVFTPLSQPLIPANQSVSFVLTNLITALNVNPNQLSSLHVQWNFVPGYADGYFSMEMQKQAASPSIASFTVSPQTITVGKNVNIAYQTEVAAYVTLAYVRRDGSQVTLTSPANLGFDEATFTPTLAPDKESTLFTLSVYQGIGLPAADVKTFPITVNQLPAIIDSFSASSQLVNINGTNTITLNWKVENAKSVVLQGFGTQTGNSLQVTVNTTTLYTLQVTPWGTNGQPVFASLTVYAYKTFASLDVGPMGNGTAFQSLPISISNRLRGIVYVANAAAGKIYQVLQATHAVSPTTFPGNILSLTPDGLKLFVAQANTGGPGSIAMFDTATSNQNCSLPEPGPPPYSLAINPAGTQMYYQQQHRLTAVSAFTVNEGGNSFAYVTDIAVGTSPEAYAFDAAGTNLYVGNYDSSNVSVINLAQNKVTATIALQSSEPCDFALVGSILFVACSGDNRVCVIDTTTNTVLAPITAGFQPFSLTLDQNKSRLFVTNFQGGTVTVIDTAKRVATSTLTVGNGPSAAKISDSGKLMFVSNYCDKSLSVVDISGGAAAVVGSIPLESTNGNPIDVSTYPVLNNYTDVFVAKEYFQGRNNGCSGSKATDANLNMSIFSIQEMGGMQMEEGKAIAETSATVMPSANLGTKSTAKSQAGQVAASPSQDTRKTSLGPKKINRLFRAMLSLLMRISKRLKSSSRGGKMRVNGLVNFPDQVG